MNDDDDYKVGYKRPPLHTRFKPGENRNPNGRRGKKPRPDPVRESDVEIFERLDAESVEYQGRRISKREVRLRVIHTKALAGDFKALAIIEAKKQKARDARQNRGSGVLLLPADVPLHEWETSAAIQQAQFREEPDANEIENDLKNLGKDKD